MFPSIQDPGHFPHNRTNTNCHCAPLTVCSERYNSHKTEKTKAKTVTVKKQKKRRMVSPLPSSSGSFLSCMYTACTQLSVTQVLLFSLSLSLSHSLSLSLHPPSLARSAFQTKARGKIPAPKFRCCWLNKPSQWRSRQQPMRKQEGRWTQPFETEKERAESSGE